jgi:glycine oxidase
MDVVIVGGGIIGLSIAWYLPREARITIVDTRRPGAASPASAGMLAPFAEATEPGPLLDLGVASLREYRHFAEAVGVKLQGPGMLRVGANDAIVEWAREHGFAAERVRGRDREPEAAFDEAVFTPDEKHVDPPALLAALRKALEVRGARFTSESATGDITVHAKGAWDERSFPVRGQLVSVKSTAIQSTIYAPGTYLIPRDGRVIIGATEEQVGFQTGTTREAIDSLLRKATALVPTLGTGDLRAWSGFRPGSRDGLPFIGRLDDRTYVATAHFRNGILLAPITGKLLAEQIVTGTIPELLKPCDPLR